MLETLITTGKIDSCYLYHKATGLAKSVAVAKWLFALTGWQSKGEYPDLCYQVATIDAPEMPEGERTELWVLGNCLQMN